MHFDDFSASGPQASYRFANNLSAFMTAVIFFRIRFPIRELKLGPGL